MDVPTWATVTTAAEPTAVLLAFVAHHIEAGASEMFIYLDKPAPEFEEIVRSVPQVRIVHSDAAVWGELHPGVVRRERVVLRQKWNARHAKRKCNADWLLHIDTDEFVPDATKLQAFLAGVPKGIWGVLLPAAERIFEGEDRAETIFGGVFRSPYRGEPGQQPVRFLRSVYGSSNRMLRFGVAGYSNGKIAVRPRSPARPRIHNFELPKGMEGHWRDYVVQCPDISLLHFDCRSYESWLVKMKRMSRRPFNTKKSRENIYRAVAADDPDFPPREVFRSLYELSDEALAKLDSVGCLHRFDLDIEGSVRRVFPGVEVDLTKEGIARAYAEYRRD